MAGLTRFLFIAVCAVLFFSGCSRSSDTDAVPARISAVEYSLLPALIQAGSNPAGMSLLDRMEHYGVPGLSIAVINGGRIEWAKGYGVTEAGGTQAVTAETLFQACSMSKAVSVTGLTLLAQSGAIDISRNVNDYLRSWQVPENQFTVNQKVTIERLMSHTGGMTVGGFSGYATGSTLPTLLQTLKGEAPANNDPVQVDHEPGSRYFYSGGGMEVLHLMAEEVAGVPFGTYMRDNLFSRLQMNSSDFIQPLSGTLAAGAAKGHDLDGTAVPGGWNVYPEFIAAGLWTTPSDLARLIIEVQKAAQGQGEVLTRNTALDILTKRPNSEHGLGFRVTDGSGGTYFHHTGANKGYKGIFLGYKDTGQGVAVMTNGDSGVSLFYEVVRSVARVYGWADFRPEEAALVELSPAALQEYAGTYRNANLDMTFQVSVSGTGLTMKFDVVERLDMFPIGSDTFLLRGGINQGKVTFARSGSTSVTGLIWEDLKDGSTLSADKI